MHPEKRIYNVQKMPMTEAAIDTGPWGDIYVSLGEPIDPSAIESGAWSVRVYHKPLVTWIWGGCVLMALGGALALSDRRYRLLARGSNGRSGTGARMSEADTAVNVAVIILRQRRSNRNRPCASCCRWRSSSCWPAFCSSGSG